MKIAIAGTGDVSSYLVEALSAQKHDIILLTRKEPAKPFPVPHRITDYTLPSLLAAIHDRTAVISTVSSYDNPSIVTPTHLMLLKAVQQSPATTIFLPSEWTSDVMNHPDQPMFMREHVGALHPALRQAKQDDPSLRYTIICNSWFMDYIVPPANRRMRDIGPMWPMDHATRTFTIYGTGEQKITFTSVRDVATAVGKLLHGVEKEGWEMEEYTFVEGDRMTWNELYEVVNEAGVSGGEWTKRVKPMSETMDELVAAEKVGEVGWEGVLLAQFELLSYSGASLLPEGKVKEHREKFFKGMKFRDVKDVLGLVKGDSDVVV